jgi:5-methylcytosine-specific restriction endonuclease McrA
MNNYQYAINPTAWVDPLGLAATSPVPKSPRGKGCTPKAKRATARIFSSKQKDEALKLQKDKCPNCGTGITKSTSDGHHIKRHADGGTTTQCNLAMICKDCHKAIHRK